MSNNSHIPHHGFDPRCKHKQKNPFDSPRQLKELASAKENIRRGVRKPSPRKAQMSEWKHSSPMTAPHLGASAGWIHDVWHLSGKHIVNHYQKKKKKVIRITHVFISICVWSKTKIQQTQGTKENLPVFSFISHKTLKRAGFILWQFSACFLQRGGFIQTSGNSSSTTYSHKIYMLFPLQGGRQFIKHAGAAKENGKYLPRIHIFFKSH